MEVISDNAEIIMSSCQAENNQQQHLDLLQSKFKIIETILIIILSIILAKSLRKKKKNHRKERRIMDSSASLDDAATVSASVSSTMATSSTYSSTTMASLTMENIIYTILYSTASLAAIGGNGVVIYLIINFRRMRSVTDLFIFNLALGDLLMAILCIPFTFTSNLIFRGWPFGPIMCRVVSYAQAVSVFISAYTLVAISIDRYIAIIYPLRLRMTKRHSQYLVAFIWLVALLTPLPTALLSRLMLQSHVMQSNKYESASSIVSSSSPSSSILTTTGTTGATSNLASVTADHITKTKTNSILTKTATKPATNSSTKLKTNTKSQHHYHYHRLNNNNNDKNGNSNNDNDNEAFINRKMPEYGSILALPSSASMVNYSASLLMPASAVLVNDDDIIVATNMVNNIIDDNFDNNKKEKNDHNLSSILSALSTTTEASSVVGQLHRHRLHFSNQDQDQKHGKREKLRHLSKQKYVIESVLTKLL